MIISTRFPQHIVLPVAIPAIQVPCWPSAAGVGPWSEVCWAPGRKTDGKRPMLDGKTMETPMGNPVEKSDVNGCYIWFDDIWCRYSSFKDACSSLEDVDSCQENCEKCRALHRYHPSIHPSIHIQMALWGTNESKLGSLAGFDPVDLFPEMGSLQQKAVLLSFPTQAEGITIPIIWLGNS